MNSNQAEEHHVELILKITKKIENNEIKRELQRLFLILSFGGILSIVISIFEYISYKNYGEDIIYLISFQSNNQDLYVTDLFLIISITSIYLTTFFVMFIFSLGKSGVINWNQIYKYLSVVLFTLFLLGEYFAFLYGRSGPKTVIAIWSVIILLTLLISIYIFKKKLGVPILINALLILLFYVTLISLISLSFLKDFINIVFYYFAIGLFLVLYSSVIVLFIFRLPPNYNFKHKSDLYEVDFRKKLSPDELKEYLDERRSFVSSQLEKSFGIDQDEFFSYLLEIKEKFSKSS